METSRLICLFVTFLIVVIAMSISFAFVFREPLMGIGSAISIAVGVTGVVYFATQSE